MHSGSGLGYDLDPERLRRLLPDRPGVYLFKERSGRVIYVGKAKSLRKRVLSYFRPSGELSHKTALMMKKAASLDVILTGNENEAFILEDSLVKKHMPRYNVVLRDDKRYPCLRLDVKSPFPSLRIVRRIKKDGAVYFGPFSSAHSVRRTLKLIDRVFQLRKCPGRELPKRSRPCLNYEMDRCLAPCSKKVSEQEYQEIIEQVRLFLEGRNQELVQRLRKKMADASERLEFEKAARIRDQIRAVERTMERQHVVSPRMEDQDVIGLAQKEGIWQLVILYIRKGTLLGSRNYVIRERTATASEVMEAFLKQYYSRESFVPKQVLVSEPVDQAASIARWLEGLAGKKVEVRRPVRGEKLRLVQMAINNARNLLAGQVEPSSENIVSLAQSTLHLAKPPRRIEGMDISNLYGDQAVGTIVSFVEGAPHRSGYRNFRIRSVDGIDDYGMMSELISRRMAKGDLPDLFLVDGGKGHLAAVKKVLNGYPADLRPGVVSLAKPDTDRHEKSDKIYLLNRKNPLQLRSNHPVLHLLMRVRDEAHRRAISYHRRLRKKELTESVLDRIPGIGPERRKALLKHFRDIPEIIEAGPEELVKVRGISRALAEELHAYFHGPNRMEQGRARARTLESQT